MSSTGLALMPVASLSTLQERERNDAGVAQEGVNEVTMSAIASHVHKRWATAKDGKRDLEQRMLQNLRQRQGKYDPDKAAQIKADGGSDSAAERRAGCGIPCWALGLTSRGRSTPLWSRRSRPTCSRRCSRSWRRRSCCSWSRQGSSQTSPSCARSPAR